MHCELRGQRREEVTHMEELRVFRAVLVRNFREQLLDAGALVADINVMRVD
jgi:hypothetical protein